MKNKETLTYWVETLHIAQTNLKLSAKEHDRILMLLIDGKATKEQCQHAMEKFYADKAFCDNVSNIVSELENT